MLKEQLATPMTKGVNHDLLNNKRGDFMAEASGSTAPETPPRVSTMQEPRKSRVDPMIDGSKIETMPRLREKFSYEKPYQEKVRRTNNTKPRIRLSTNQYERLTRNPEDKVLKQTVFDELTSTLNHARKEIDRFSLGTRVVDYDPKLPLTEKVPYEKNDEERTRRPVPPIADDTALTPYGTRFYAWFENGSPSTTCVPSSVSEPVATNVPLPTAKTEEPRNLIIEESKQAAITEAKKEEGVPKDYLQATIESKVKDILYNRAEGNPVSRRRPVWDVLNNEGVRAIAERRAFVEKLRQEASLKRYRQELQREWDDRAAQREQRRQERLQEARPGFLSRFTNFFKERTKKLTEFLSEPNTEVARIRQTDIESLKEWKKVVKGGRSKT